MAAYAATVTLDASQVKGMRLTGTRGFGILRGVVDVTNYNTTLAEITGITKYFVDTPTVILGGISDNGYPVAWIPASKSIKAWYLNAFRTGSTATADSTAGALAEDTAAAETALRLMGTAVDTTYALSNLEVATDVHVGAIPFLAIGRM